MFLKYIPKTLQFHHIPEWKYENCPTREERKEELGARQRSVPSIKHRGLSCVATPVVTLDWDYMNLADELFAGDNIFGIFSGENGTEACLYKWKRNNTRKITAYAMLQEWEWDSMVDGGVHIIKPVK